MADRIRVYEEKDKKGLPVWAWLVPLLIVLALLGVYFAKHRPATSPQSAVAGPAPTTVAEPIPTVGPSAAAASGSLPNLGTVHFATDTATLTQEGQATLDQAVAAMKANPGARLRLEGYTDATGTVPHNVSLSDQRTAAVAGYLKTHGIAESRLTGEGFGPAEPVASNATASGKADNRRVELFVKP